MHGFKVVGVLDDHDDGGLEFVLVVFGHRGEVGHGAFDEREVWAGGNGFVGEEDAGRVVLDIDVAALVGHFHAVGLCAVQPTTNILFSSVSLRPNNKQHRQQG